MNLLTVLSIILLLAVSSCVTGTDTTGPNSSSAVPYIYTELPRNTAVENKHVILIGLDGWGAYSLPKADMPVVKRMMREGAYSLKTLSVNPSNSGPNWSSMFFGTGPEKNGYTYRKNQAIEFRSPVKDPYGFFPNIFAALKAQMPESLIGYFYEWIEIGRLCPPEVLDYKKWIPDLSYNREAVEAIGDYIKTKKPALTLIAFNEPDHTGHSKGHSTKAYYKMLTQLDRFIGIIEEAVREAGIYDETVFVLSADHGGILWGHGGYTFRETQIPLVFFGSAIKKEHIISQPTHIYDIAPTIAAIFELDPLPIWEGRSVKEIFTDE